MTRLLRARFGEAGAIRHVLTVLALLALACLPLAASAQATLPALTATPGPNGSETYSLSVQTLLMLTSLTFIPAALLMMTGFTRIIIVLSLMRNALGTQTTPPNLVLVGLALFLTAYTMSPVFDQIYKDAYQPLSNGAISFETAIDRGSQPLRTFMMHQTRETDLSLFANLTNQPPLDDPSAVPMKILVPAFITSELKTAFQIGFTIFIPFLIIDMVVASVLMGLGMMMVPPISVSLPFKLMLFVLADGWHMLLGSLARSFYQ
ncbi:flagellar type III secretion system pore protein FliP [Bordetella genomosp. 11]|uniref:Flagellar biosynthetic protein FliP n=1 Tax=Bordetella genomosp. 11 TaxID=1416808 RepID=A0A261UEF6_9BORD|nr:flagellar type III secretion system pore protein FliP [Bordetella genomosp. 11]OZI60316.1 flagellar biosynthetic protein FliP [Bordetella genomosp. 11]